MLQLRAKGSHVYHAELSKKYGPIFKVCVSAKTLHDHAAVLNARGSNSTKSAAAFCICISTLAAECKLLAQMSRACCAAVCTCGSPCNWTLTSAACRHMAWAGQ